MIIGLIFCLVFIFIGVFDFIRIDICGRLVGLIFLNIFRLLGFLLFRILLMNDDKILIRIGFL